MFNHHSEILSFSGKQVRNDHQNDYSYRHFSSALSPAIANTCINGMHQIETIAAKFAQGLASEHLNVLSLSALKVGLLAWLCLVS